MRDVPVRVAVGLALAVLLTATLAGAVVTAAAVSDELSDGDGCETGGSTAAEITASSGNVTNLVGNVSKCVAGGESADRPPNPSFSGPSAPGPR